MIVWINELDENLKGRFYFLNRIANSSGMNDFLIPNSFLIKEEVFNRFLDYNDLRKEIENFLRIDLGNSENIKEISREIQGMIYNAEFPPDVESEIMNAYRQIHLSNEIRSAGSDAIDLVRNGLNSRVIVAFNNNSELFYKIWNVKGANNLMNAIKKAYAEIFSEEMIKAFKGNNLQIDSGIIVQLMPDSEKFCIVYTKDPRDMSEKVVVESNYGIGKIFENEGSDIYIIDKSTGRIDSERIAIKDFMFKIDELSGEIVQESLDEELKRKSSLNPKELSNLIVKSVKLESIFKRPLKIEYSLNKGRLSLIGINSIPQPKIEEVEKIHGRSFAKGFPVSYGFSKGVLKFLNSFDEIENLEGDVILYAFKPSIELLNYFDRIRALIFRNGNFSEPVSSFARENGIPVIIADEIPYEFENVKIGIDSFSGNVIVINEEIEEEDFDAITGIDIMSVGKYYVDNCDGCIVFERLTPNEIYKLSERFRPFRIWVKNSYMEYPVNIDNVGIIYETHELGNLIRSNSGVIVRSFASLAQIEEFLPSFSIIILDVESLLSELESNEIRALSNTVRKISAIKEGNLCALIKDVDPEIIEKLIMSGCDSFAISRDKIRALKKVVAKKEKKVILHKLRKI